MTITADGWFTWAVRDPGPAWKVNGGRNDCRGVVPHSAEGYWPVLRSELWRADRRASWAASNLADGRFIQHYPISAQTWTSGASYPNNHFFAFENEGVAGVSLTDAQVDNIVRVIWDLSARFQWEPRRPVSAGDLTATLYEHREMTRWGADPTACPSGRIPWDRILEEIMGPTKEEFQALFKYVQRVDAATKFLIDTTINLAGQVYGSEDAPEVKGLLERVAQLEKEVK